MYVHHWSISESQGETSVHNVTTLLVSCVYHDIMTRHRQRLASDALNVQHVWDLLIFSFYVTTRAALLCTRIPISSISFITLNGIL
jgi:hypothetical protein